MLTQPSPLETFTVKTDRHPYASAKLAKLSKLKAAEFKKNRYSTKFKDLKAECKTELRRIKQSRIQEAVRAGDSNNSWLGRMEQLLDPNGNTDRRGGVLPEKILPLT